MKAQILHKLKQQTVAHKIPADRGQTTMTVQIDSKHVEGNLNLI